MPDKNQTFRKITVCAVFAVFAAITGLLESMLGLDVYFPVPGVRLGLANLFVMAAFVLYGARFSMAVSLVRMGLVFLLSGNVTALILSFSGGMCAFIGLCALMPLYGKKCTMIGVSAFSSALHGIGQLAAAYFLIHAPVFWYLPVLCALSAVTGCINGFLLDRLLPLFPQSIRNNARYGEPIHAQTKTERKDIL